MVTLICVLNSRASTTQKQNIQKCPQRANLVHVECAECVLYTICPQKRPECGLNEDKTCLSIDAIIIIKTFTNTAKIYHTGVLHLSDWYSAFEIFHMYTLTLYTACSLTVSLQRALTFVRTQPAFGACFFGVCLLPTHARLNTYHRNVCTRACRVVASGIAAAAPHGGGQKTKWPVENWQRCFQPVLRDRSSMAVVCREPMPDRRERERQRTLVERVHQRHESEPNVDCHA